MSDEDGDKNDGTSEVEENAETTEHEDSEQEYVDDHKQQDKGDTGLDNNECEPKFKRSYRTVRSKLSDKVENFQVRVKILEGRQLAGSNIKAAVKVKCGPNLTKITCERKGASSVWGKTMIFNFKESLKNLYDLVLEFRVNNSKRQIKSPSEFRENTSKKRTISRSDSLIGHFKLDLGNLYDQKGHAYVRKWILLTDPEDSSNTSKGYLKTTMCILGAGDEPPSEHGKEDDDVEGNVLTPAGAALRSFNFVLRVYKAEDIPQMDGNNPIQILKKSKTGLADPYLTFRFAGKKKETKVIENSRNPEWNEELSLSLKFPSMCNAIQLAVFDRDTLTKDDPVGTIKIPLSRISSAGDEVVSGFLPTFGPTFVNMYGSKREYSDYPFDPLEPMNHGKCEGCAYRGRVMVELETRLDEENGGKKECTRIDEDLIESSKKYLRRRKNELVVTFESASMIEKTDEYIEFEVSIGNFGNKFDSDTQATSSTTEPIRAISDGTYYYYLPWGQNKPIVWVPSHWEDSGFRCYALNVLLRMTTKMESDVELVKKMIAEDDDKTEVANKIVEIFDDLISFCTENPSGPSPLPDPRRRTAANSLDARLYRLRMQHFKSIVAEATPQRDTCEEVAIAVGHLEEYLERLKDITYEPQSSIPDVFIWMLSGNKRIAYARIPANEVLFCKDNKERSGRMYGKMQTIFLKYPTVKRKSKEDFKIACKLQAKIWLMRFADHADFDFKSQGKMSVWAETYETERKYVAGTSWTACGFKDLSGEITLPREKFECPPGWKWAEDWSPSNLSYNVLSGFGVFTEEAWEKQDRLDYWGMWQKKGFLYREYEGLRNLDDIECPEGWQWQDDEWKVDYSGALDEEGWMYKNDIDTTWDSIEKVFHLNRKRRFVRTRKCTAESLTKKESGGWEYVKTRYRRKLWMRRLVAEETKGAAAIFTLDRPLVHFVAVPDGDTSTSIEEPPTTPTDSTRFEFPTPEPVKEPGKMKRPKKEKRKNADTSDAKSKTGFRGIFMKGKADTPPTPTKKQKKGKEMTLDILGTKANNKKKILRLPTPRIYMKFENSVKLQLRVYIYQARSLYPMDQDNFSDPFVIANFMNACKRTELCHHTLNPIWDQSLIMDLEYFGDLSNLETSCPDVILEIFDKDDIVPVGTSTLEDKRGRIKKSSIEFMGRSALQPLYKPDSKATDRPTPRLAWRGVMRGNVQAGSLLAAAELILKTKDKKMPSLPPGKTDMPSLPPGKTGMYKVPPGIRPKLQRTALEFLVWGVRNMKPYKLLSVERPSVVIEMGKVEVRSEVVKKYKKCPNFSRNVFYFGDECLPREQIYRPPIVIRVKDHRKFGRRPTVGQHVLSLDMSPSPPIRKEGECEELEDMGAVIDIAPDTPTKDSKRETEEDKEHVKIEMCPPAAALAPERDTSEEEEEEEEPSGKTIIDTLGNLGRQTSQIFTSELRKEEIDWWSKYYASKGECEQYKSTGMDTIKVYKNELEMQKPYNNFSDFVETFPLYRGKQGKYGDDTPRVVGEFKGAIFMYRLPEDHTDPMPKILRNIPSSKPVEVKVRVYVIRAFDLAPQDSNGLADPYLKIKAGKKKKVDRSNYLPNTLEPVFGRMFELDLVLPMEKDLRIEVFDWDLIGTDDKVGETVIDLENRYYSKYKAWCGLPKTYCTQGINKWRDQLTPREWLIEKAKEMGIDEPAWNNNTCVLFNRKKYPLERFEKENEIARKDLGPPDQRLALHVLKTLPHVPEHVETRPLYIDTLPGIEQGRLELWVDMFPKKFSNGKPGAAVDISPRQPSEYFLRVIVWNCEEIPMMDTSVFGEQMSDIYVKGWMGGKEHKTQKTDVHHRSLDGSGMFNWRFIFPFDYLQQERVIVVKKKDHLFSLDETTAKFPPILHIQVWDEDTFGPNEYISEIEIPMINAPKPSKFSRFATLKNILDFQGNCEVPHVNMFDRKMMRGWWPLYEVKDGEKRQAGKIEMTIELATKEEHEEKPAGKARNEPNENPKLEKPMRPATSFAWFTSPWKSFRYVIWRKYGCMVITIVIVFLLSIFVLLFLYTLPGSVTRYMVRGH